MFWKWCPLPFKSIMLHVILIFSLRQKGGAKRAPGATVFTSRLNIKEAVLKYCEPQWKDTLLPSFLTCSSGTTTMTFSGPSSVE